MKKLIPERLTKAREALGITKAEAARKCGLTKIGYCRYEYGDRTPSPQTIEILAQRLDTSVNYLTGESNESESDIFIVYRNQTPFLYELIRSCEASGEEMSKRLLAYYRSLANTKNPKP